MKNDNFRAYFFTNFYLSSLQQGLQSAHVTAELFLRYSNNISHTTEYTKLKNWAKHDKTIIILNGGNHESLNRLYSEIIPLAEALILPYAKFSEDGQSLNQATTAVGIIIPEEIYKLPPSLNEHVGLFVDQQLKSILDRYSLAK